MRPPQLNDAQRLYLGHLASSAMNPRKKREIAVCEQLAKAGLAEKVLDEEGDDDSPCYQITEAGENFLHHR